jgi:arylsulfatase A-like enzyme
LQSAGYRTYHIGKWFASIIDSPLSYNPVMRGYDYFYGNLEGGDYYYTRTKQGHVGVYENLDPISASDELDPTLHGVILYQTKAELILTEHKEYYAERPFFLFYSTLLLHSPFHDVGDKYMGGCEAIVGAETKDIWMCGMTAMLDEVLHNLTCKIDELGFADNTLYVIISDNGGSKAIDGTNYPLRGGKAQKSLGGTRAPGFIYSPIIPSFARGTTYNGTVHVTDWLPTLMGLATANTWNGSYANATIDGVDVWDAIISNTPSPRIATLHYSLKSGTALDREVSYQENNYRYIQQTDVYPEVYEANHVFNHDAWAGIERETCLPMPADDFYGMDAPSFQPTTGPSIELTAVPSAIPSLNPTTEPSSELPSAVPTIVEPSAVPSFNPTTGPSSELPSAAVPTSVEPSVVPSSNPTTGLPTRLPSSAGGARVIACTLGLHSLILVALCISWTM